MSEYTQDRKTVRMSKKKQARSRSRVYRRRMLALCRWYPAVSVDWALRWVRRAYVALSNP